MTDYCMGCKTLHYINKFNEVTHCRFQTSNVEGKCPCSECIVKMMCDTDCPTFREYTDVIDTILKLKKEKPYDHI